MPDFVPNSQETFSNIEQEENNRRDLLFFDPPYHADQELAYAIVKDSDKNMDLPRGMLSISSYLEDHEISSDVVPMDAYLYSNRERFLTDGKFDQDKFAKAIEALIDEKVDKANPKVLAFGLMYTFAEPTVLEMTRYAKDKYPDKYVVVGGNHATFNDVELLDPESNTGIDIVVRFEGEAAMQELMTELAMPAPDLTKIKGISYKDSAGNLHQNPPRDRMDLYELPPLNYDLVDSPESMDKFNHTAMFLRGCKGNCAFCTSPRYWNRELKEGKASNFITEIEYLAENGVEMVGVLDDDILASEEGFKVIIESLKEVRAKYPNIKFIAQTRVIHLREKEECQAKLADMKEAGISRLYLGIESGSQEILNEMSKGLKVEWIEPALRNVKESGMETGGFWLVGHPGATVGYEQQSIDFMEHLLEEKLLDDVEAHGVVPFPGTRIADDPRIQVFDKNKKHYGFMNNYPVYNLIDPETGEITLSAEEMNGELTRVLELRRDYLGIPIEKDHASV